MEIKKDKQKLLYIVTQSEWGGAQKYIFDLATNLANDFDIAVAAGPDGTNHDLINKLENFKIRTHLFKHLKRNINPYHDFLAILEIAKFLKQRQFDIIHLNSSKAGVIGALANKLAVLLANTKHTKVIYTAHGWAYLEPQNTLKQVLYLNLERLANNLRHATIVLSNKEKEVALKYQTAKKENIFIIPNGIALNKLIFLDKKTAKKDLNLPTENFIIGTIANLYKTKGLKYLIEAVQILNEQNSFNNCQLIIIGEGQTRKNLEMQIQHYNLQNKIILFGSLSDASKYLKAFGIFVLPSIKEGFPYTILEAMAAELPIIATKVGAIPEIIRDVIDGLLIEPKNPQELSMVIKNLINNSNLQTQLATSAKERCNQYSLDNMINKTKEVYIQNPA